MENKLFDSHLHLADEKLYPEWEKLFQNALDAGVEKFLVVATNPDEMEKAIGMKKKYPQHFFVAASITPHEAHTASKEEVEVIFTAAKEGKLDALGETGLEYYYLKETASQQLELLERSLQLATSLDLPVIFHCREAFTDLYPLLDKYRPRGILHCFTGTTEEVQEVLKRNLFVSFSGIVTYKKSEALRETAQHVPLERLLIETDAPYLAPQAFRGKTNEPAFIKNTLEVLAEALSVSSDTLASQTYNNALSLFCS